MRWLRLWCLGSAYFLGGYIHSHLGISFQSRYISEGILFSFVFGGMFAFGWMLLGRGLEPLLRLNWLQVSRGKWLWGMVLPLLLCWLEPSVYKWVLRLVWLGILGGVGGVLWRYLDRERMGVLLRCYGIDLLFLLILLGGIFVWQWEEFWYYSGDRRLLSCYQSDEALVFQHVSRMVEFFKLQPVYFVYGGFYFTVCFLGLHLLGLVVSLGDEVIIVFNRLVEFGSFCGVVVLFYSLAYRVFGRAGAIYTALLVSLIPNLLYWSTLAHPDILQLFLLVASVFQFYNYFQGGDERDLWLGSVFLGACIATKYSGLFFLPPLGLALFFHLWQRRPYAYWQEVLGEWWRRILVVFGICVGIFVFLNINIFSYFSRFLRHWRYSGRNLSFGFPFQGEANPNVWFKVLISPTLVCEVQGLLLLVGFCMGMVYFLYRRPAIGARGVLLVLLGGWVLFYFFFLYFRIYEREPRYLLPAVIFFPFLSAGVWGGISWRSWWEKVGGGGVLCAILGLYGYHTIEHYKELRERKRSNVRSLEDVEPGRWLRKNYPPSVWISYGYYTYIPPEYKHAFFSFTLPLKEVKGRKIDLIFLNDRIYGIFLDPRNAKRYVRGEKVFLEAYRQYRRYLADEDPDYKLLKRFGTTYVFGKRK